MTIIDNRTRNVNLPTVESLPVGTIFSVVHDLLDPPGPIYVRVGALGLRGTALAVSLNGKWYIGASSHGPQLKAQVHTAVLTVE